MRKRNRKLAAALGFVATVGAFGGGDAFENVAVLGKESATASRPIGVKTRLGALESPSGFKAFMVGADDYYDAMSLKCVKNDVEKMAARLLELGFDKENVTVLKTGGSFSDYPTKTIIEARFQTFVDSLRPGDFAVVFLSGHGLQPTDSKEAFFAPIDVNAKEPIVSSVSIDGMLKKLDASQAKFRWMIVDACRNEPAFVNRSVGAKGLTGIAFAPKGTSLFQSCQPGELAYEGEENGLFTSSLLEALDSKNAKVDVDGDGFLAFSEVIKYATERTSELARRSGKSQKPCVNSGCSDFAILSVDRRASIWGTLALLALNCVGAGAAFYAGRRQRPETEADAARRRLEAELAELRESQAATRRQAEDAAKRAEEATSKAEEATAELAKAREEKEAAERKAKEAENAAPVVVPIVDEKREEADRLAAEACAAFELGDAENVEKAIRLTKKSLESVDSVANRRLLKTFEEAFDALRKPAPAGTKGTGAASQTLNGWDAEHKAGTRQTLQIKGLEYAFRFCPAGRFLMGSPESESGRYDDEGPRHYVTLTKSFWLLETSVTQAMWKSIMGGNPSWFSASGGGASAVLGLDTSNFPVEQASWDDCKLFISELNSLGVAPKGFLFRLPTEAEWEYACRAGSDGAYFWGASLNGDKANCDGTNPCGTSVKGPYLERTTAVGSYAANEWGLRDMHGNVYDWCEDWYDSKFYEKSNSAQNPINVTPDSDRVLRGGGWGSGAKGCRSAYRYYNGPTSRRKIFGFRLALVQSSSSSK